MIARLFPETVSCADTRDDVPSGTLFPEEEVHVARSVDKRRREFTAVRACARRAMAGLGLPPVPVLPGRRGAPGWPPGIVGSMTHCAGYRAAVLARAEDFRGLGVDAEPNAPLPPDVLDVVSLPAERGRLNGPAAQAWTATADGGVHGDRLLFSAKESVFKAWYPLTGIELGFEEADLRFQRAADGTPEGTFEARLLRTAPGMPEVFEGRWLVREGLVVTAVALPA